MVTTLKQMFRGNLKHIVSKSPGTSTNKILSLALDDKNTRSLQLIADCGYFNMKLI
jgi:hypothetical protein